MCNKIISVLFPIPTNNVYDYLIDNSFADYSDMEKNIVLGSIVLAPFGHRNLVGVVVELKRDTSLHKDKLKSIIDVLDIPAFSANTLKFLSIVASYNLQSKGGILKLILPKMSLKVTSSRTTSLETTSLETTSLETTSLETVNKKFIAHDKYFVISKDFSKFTKKQKLVAKMLLVPMKINEIVQKTDVSTDIIKRMIRDKKLVEADISLFKDQLSLTSDQQIAYDSLKKNKKFGVSLLHGVTGSGKTEVFFKLAWQELLKGRQVLINIPEVSLLLEVSLRFQKRFGIAPYQWHSGISQNRKAHMAYLATKGQAMIVIGTRSALFLPFSNLSLMVVDEEQDSSYKQENKPTYNARDMAIFKAKINDIPIILASATPSVETYANCLTGKYSRVVLKLRYGGNKYPNCQIIDMRNTKDKILSHQLIDQITLNLKQKEQSILFLNKRGYARLIYCKQCFNKIGCPNCSSWLVYYETDKLLRCNYCNYTKSFINQCPSCHAKNSLKEYGFGIEKVRQRLLTTFPEANIYIADSQILEKKEVLTDFLAQMARGAIDILVGTQIISKGYNFTGVTLVGILDADYCLSGEDIKSTETNYQLISQTIGRAGRGKKSGRAIIQTYDPQNDFIKMLAKVDDNTFYSWELSRRKLNKIYPFGKLAQLTVAGEDRLATQKLANNIIAKFSKSQEKIAVYGPKEANILKLKKKYRYKILFKSNDNILIQKYILKHISGYLFTKIGKFLITIDIDPWTFY